MQLERGRWPTGQQFDMLAQAQGVWTQIMQDLQTMVKGVRWIKDKQQQQKKPPELQLYISDIFTIITKQEFVQLGPFKGCLYHPVIYYNHLIFSWKRGVKKKKKSVFGSKRRILVAFTMGWHFEVFSLKMGWRFKVRSDRCLLGPYYVPTVATVATRTTKINKSCACHKEITSENRSMSR